MVKRGDPLFRLDDRDLKAQLLVAEANLQAADSPYERLLAAPQQGEIPTVRSVRRGGADSFRRGRGRLSPVGDPRRTPYIVQKRKTSRSRFRRGLTVIADWCRKDRHDALLQQHTTLSQKRRGHFAYDGITGNADAWNRFRRGVIGLGRKWLGRRHRGGEVAWERMDRLRERYPLPPAIVVHSVYRRAAKV
jgi:hypothetical protein